jgi:hypothetical protein
MERVELESGSDETKHDGAPSRLAKTIYLGYIFVHLGVLRLWTEPLIVQYTTLGALIVVLLSQVFFMTGI